MTARNPRSGTGGFSLAIFTVCDRLYVQACEANTATTAQLNAVQARLAAVLAVCDSYDPGLFPLAQIRAAAQ